MTEFENEFFKTVHKLESLIKENKEFDIKLPRVCLMGIPHSGKSLLLSSIIGLDILPIDQTLAIKRPLELRLNHLDSGEPYAIFEEIENEKITDFSKIKDIIQKIQEKKGQNYEQYFKSIILNIYSQKFANIAFIDLPGMTYIPIGLCPKNIEEFPTKLAAKYANDFLNLLVCTVPVKNTNLDKKIYCFRCIENFGMSRHRVLPVFTKIDLITEDGEELQEFKEFITNKVLPFKFGCVCIKNRTSENLKNNMNLKDAIEEEKKFFNEGSNLYGKFSEDQVGYDTLIKKLKKGYFELIKENLAKEDKNQNQLITKGRLAKNKEEKNSIREILKFINDNSYKENDAFNPGEIKLTKEKDLKNFQNLIDFIEENAKDD